MELLTDFTSFKKMTYEEYVKRKGYTILALSNVSDNFVFEKRFNRLFITDKGDNSKRSLVLDELSIIDVLNIIIDLDKTLEVFRYKENDISVLNASALFLTDFSTEKKVKYKITERPVNLNGILRYTDDFNSDYKYKSLTVLGPASQAIPYTIKNNQLFLEQNLMGDLYVTYQATDLKIQMLKEFVLSDPNQLFTFNEVRPI